MRVAARNRDRIENAVYNRAADLAKSYVAHWDREGQAAGDDAEAGFDAGLKAGHWRIIEKAIRGLPHADPKNERRS